MLERATGVAAYDENVFFNCPFDEVYRPIFEALVFAAFDCGYVPRCALEADDAGQVRIEKILAMIRGCRLGVHDVSRTELDGAHSLPRFNMPSNLACSSALPDSAPATSTARSASSSIGTG